MDNGRLAFIRRGLRRLGLQEEAVNTAFQRWEQGTLTDYDRVWDSWVKFSRSTDGDLCDSSDARLASFVSYLINDKSYSERSVAKASSIVRTTTDLAAGVGLTHVMTKAAGKINRPASAN